MKKLLVILSIMFATANASAGILLEPYVGYHMGSSEGSEDVDYKGMGYGGRIGWTLPIIFFAFDYSAATVDYEASPTVDADMSAMSLVVGANLPVVRVWAGYSFATEIDIEDFIKIEGSGMKAGVGFKLPALPISFNLEYVMATYDDPEVGTLTNDIDASGLFVSVSAPLEF